MNTLHAILKVTDARRDVRRHTGRRTEPPPLPPSPFVRDNLPRNAKFWKLDVLDVVKLFQNIMTSPIISQI